MKKTASILTVSAFAVVLAFLLGKGVVRSLEQTALVGSEKGITKEAETEASMMTTIQRDVAAREYHIHFQENANALQSPNRAQNLRFTYRPDGFSMKTRVDTLGTENWEVSMKVEGVYRGRSRVIAPEQNPKQEIKCNHLQYHHKGGLTIEYKNDFAGMRQNFILESKPDGEGPLAVAMELETALEPLLSSQKELVFAERTPEQTLENKVRYKDLKVFDAKGEEMPAEMKLQGNLLALVVNDRDATYPLTIDPLSSTADATLEINQANAELGTSVSSAGDVNGDGFSDVIVGAQKYDNGQLDEGAAFIFHGSQAGISTTAATVIEGNQTAAYLGSGVSSAGDVNGDGYSDVIIGARRYDNGESDEGTAFVYHGSAVGINTTPAATLESNQASAWFGHSVSGAGDVNGDGYSDVIVGAYLYDNGESDEGAAMIYHGSGSGIISTPARTLEINQATSWFGYSVSGAGDVNGDGYSDVVVGAYLYDNGHSNEGGAFVYHGSAAGIGATAATVVEGNQVSVNLGYSVSAAGDVNADGYTDLALGAKEYNNGQNAEGGVYVNHGSASGISATPAVILESNQAFARLGMSVSSTGDVNGDGYSDVIAGAPFYDNGESDEGAAFVYYGSGTGVSTTAAVIIESDQASAYMGIAVACAGDVNGDGHSDVIIGTPRYTNGESSEGIATVYHGAPGGISASSAAHLEVNQASALFGYSLSSAGDVNGDGYDDVIVGARYYDNGQANEGAAFVYHGSATGISTSPAVLLENNQANADFGYSLSSAGDVNGDGYGDVVVGSTTYDNSLTDQGAAYFYYGSPSGIPAVAGTIIEGDQASAYFGESVSSAGDVNGDGYSDVIIGQSLYDNGQKR